MLEKLKNNKVLGIIAKVIKYILITALVLFVFMVCLQRFTNNRISLFNFRLFTVVSGSMEPKYNIGDVLVAVETKPEDVKIGDAVSYLGTKRELKDKVVTHQVIDIEKDKDGKYLFHTKGICTNCIVEDPIVKEDALYGVVKYKLVILSYIYKVVGKPVGLFIFVILPLVYVIGSEVITSLLEKEEKRRNKAK